MLKVDRISKGINEKKILDNITFNVKPKEIFGFLGPNGAGKSTTMKIISGLIKPDEGSVFINNIDLLKDKINAVSNLSALIESPKFYDYLSAKENLMQLARLDNFSYKDVEDSLKLVGLYEKRFSLVKTFSLGMKQRLAIAQVLMGKKKLLILDEPTNGLDANGVLDFRKILKTIVNERDVAIFISSHKLDEIEKLCDKFAFINYGKIISIENVHLDSKSTCFLRIFTKDTEKCITTFNSITYIENINLFEYGVVIQFNNDYFRDIIEVLIKNNINFYDLQKKEKSLEERYIDLIGGDSYN